MMKIEKSKREPLNWVLRTLFHKRRCPNAPIDDAARSVPGFDRASRLRGKSATVRCRYCRRCARRSCKQTERLYWIHLKLDSASTAVTEAEMKARNDDCSDAEYMAAEAYRNLEQADEALLELGARPPGVV